MEKNQRVLIIDSGPAIDQVCKILKKAGHEITSTVQFQNAILAAERGTADVIVVRLVNKAWLPVLRHIKAGRPKQRIIIAVPRSAHAHLCDIFLDAGAEAVLREPYDPDGLRMIIEKTGKITGQEAKKRGPSD